MKISMRAVVALILALALIVALVEVWVLWGQVGRVQTELSQARSRIANLQKDVAAYRKREEEAKRIDTSSKRDEWLLTNGKRSKFEKLVPPAGYGTGLKRAAWELGYSPRKGEVYDVAFVEWRLSGRSRQGGLAELLWVVSVINSSKVIGFNMSIDLEFLDANGFGVAKDRGEGYVFPMRDEDEGLPHITKLRGSLWVPLQLAKEISEVTGVWRATPAY